MPESEEWRTAAYFEYWKARLGFVQKLDQVEHRHEVHVLAWAALDALAWAWSPQLCKTDSLKGRQRFDEFLAEHGPEPFRRISLPDVWYRIDERHTENLHGDAVEYLKALGRLAVPSPLTSHQTRQWLDDPHYQGLLDEVLRACPAANPMQTGNWIRLSRHGSVAYKCMRSAYLHEGRPGGSTHGFNLNNSSNGPTYQSGLYSRQSILGYSPEYMISILDHCISSFEEQALAIGVDPVPAE